LYELHSDFIGSHRDIFGTRSWRSAAYAACATDFRRQRNLQKAAAMFAKCLELDPENPVGQFGLAILGLRRAGDSDVEKIAAHRRAIQRLGPLAETIASKDRAYGHSAQWFQTQYQLTATQLQLHSLEPTLENVRAAAEHALLLVAAKAEPTDPDSDLTAFLKINSGVIDLVGVSTAIESVAFISDDNLKDVVDSLLEALA
jgi:tetratricopeptide (TPR) repeat protein